MPITIYKRGRFWWLTGNDATGTRVHQSTGTTVEDEAHQLRILREREGLDSKLLGPKVVFTFGAAVAAYLDAGKGDRFMKPLLDHFGNTRISDLTGVGVRAAAKTLYPSAVYTSWNRHVVTPIKAVINHSADAGNCHPVKIKGFSKRDRDIRVPTTPPRRAVDRAYINSFRKRSDDPRLSALLLFMFQTGARIGDALKLKDDSADIDLINRKVIFRDMKNGEDGEADLTIEMVYEIQQLRIWKRARLAAWEARIPWDRKRSGERHSGRGTRKPNNRLFGFMARASVYKDIKRICAAAGIPYLGTHQPGRHSFATEMIVRNGIDVATTAAIGRWRSKQLLMNTYVHGRRGRDVVDRVFGTSGPHERGE
jgi:hypothetical protein